MAYLGCGFQEAADLQAAHFDILQKLQSKQSPVEDLLRQADNLICNHKNRAEVYTAMAESLGMAWRDLINLLDERKYILDQNYVFQGHFQVNIRITLYFHHQRIKISTLRLANLFQDSCFVFEKQIQERDCVVLFHPK